MGLENENWPKATHHQDAAKLSSPFSCDTFLFVADSDAWNRAVKLQVLIVALQTCDSPAKSSKRHEGRVAREDAGDLDSGLEGEVPFMDQAAAPGSGQASVNAGDGGAPAASTQLGRGRRSRGRNPRPQDQRRQPPQQQKPPPQQKRQAALPALPLPPHQLTWQQQQEFPSPAAPPFLPSMHLLGPQAHVAVAGQQQRERRPRGTRVRNKGLANTAQLPPQPEWQQGQQSGAAVPAGDWSEAPAGLQEGQNSQTVCPNSRQRRRGDRLPRGQQQLRRQQHHQHQQQRGAGSLSQTLDAAASTAANQHQRQQQEEVAAAGGDPSSSSSIAEAAGPCTGAQAAAVAEQVLSSVERKLGAAQLLQKSRNMPCSEQQAGQMGADAAAGSAGGDAVAATAAAAVALGGGQAQAQAQAQSSHLEAPHPEVPHCLVCCSELAEVGIGPCNHKQVCGTCTLRLRLCYGRHDCPLCKTELKEVIIAPWRPQLPNWQDYQQHPEWVARTAKWARGEIWADRWRRGGRLSSRLLHDLQRRTAMACSVCDAGGEAPFGRRELLLGHVQQGHGLWLCPICLQEGRLFPLELQAFPSLGALQAHSSAAHPHCSFCRHTFYDDDALWKHMHQAHYSCHVCPPLVAATAYFSRAPDLLLHMRNEHFMCEEPECVDCFVAFTSAEELRRHHLERHSARMPRWNSSRARPLQLDISYGRRPGQGPPLSAAEVAEERRRQRQRPRDPQDVRMLDGSGEEEQQRRRRQQWPSGFEYAREADGGLLVIDDADFPSVVAAHPGRGTGTGGSLSSGFPAGPLQRTWRQGGAGGMDAFPSLSAAAADSGSTSLGSSGAGSSRPLPLVKKTVKCPCGRRVSHCAVAEGQEVPPLECDAVCRIEGRRQQLANAFGVDNPECHASAFERNRAAKYSGLLVAAAQKHPRFIEGVERQLAEFVADIPGKRVSLSSMPREQRAVVHALAEQYGLASTSCGHEPQRYVELFKTPSAGIPARLLSRVAPTVPAEQVAALLKEAEGYALRLTDVAMSVDPRFYLRQWEGLYSVEWEGGDAAVVRFQREHDLKDALDVLGGGIRGLFRIDRSWRPKTAVAVTAPASTASSGSRCWGSAEAGGGSGGEEAAGAASWTAVAVAPRPASRPEQQQQHVQQAAVVAGGSGDQRWAVMSGRRAARPHAVVSRGSRNLLAEMLPEDEDVLTTDDSSDDE